jgi:predicted dinucleotide-binding enzyme
MNLAILGAGNVGRALTAAAIRAGHTVTVTAADPEHAERLARDTGAHAAGSNRDAVAGADVVILAVPYAAIDAITAELGDAANGKTLVDVTNRLNFENPAATMDGSSNAEHIQALLPGSRVVKAFNTVFASRQAEPVVDGVRLDGYVAADDESAKAAVLELVDSVGLRPIDVGPLAFARALEAMATVNMTLNARHGWPWQSGWKLLGPTD